MSSIAIPLIELGAQELPILLPIFIREIHAIKQIFTKPPGTQFTPTQAAEAAKAAQASITAQVQAASTQGLTKALTPDAIAALTELIYQLQKTIEQLAPTSTPTVDAGTSVALAILDILKALAPVITPLAVVKPA